MIENVFQNIPANLPNELFETLLNSEHVKIERIVSKGHKSPQDFWYDQDQSEWILILKGEAKVRIANNETTHLRSGDYVNIPAHIKHRVEWTSTTSDTIWLAIFY